MDYIKKLEEFHKKVFLKTGCWSADTNQKFIPDNDTANLRAYLIREESGELEDVLTGSDSDCSKEHLLKELTDVLYVVFGTIVTYNLPIEEAFERTHLNNILKIETGEIMGQEDFIVYYRNDLTEDRKDWFRSPLIQTVLTEQLIYLLENKLV